METLDHNKDLSAVTEFLKGVDEQAPFGKYKIDQVIERLIEVRRPHGIKPFSLIRRSVWRAGSNGCREKLRKKAFATALARSALFIDQLTKARELLGQLAKADEEEMSTVLDRDTFDYEDRAVEWFGYNTIPEQSSDAL